MQNSSIRKTTSTNLNDEDNKTKEIKLTVMKQVININFHGQVVPIEVSAFDLLKNYTASLSSFFANEEGKDEIIFKEFVKFVMRHGIV